MADDLDLIAPMVAAYNEWQWRNTEGQWIEMGGAVNVLSKFLSKGAQRQRRRGVISKILSTGAEITFKGGDKEFIPAVDIKNRIEPFEEAKAILPTVEKVENKRIPITELARSYARKVHDRARNREPEITARLQSIVGDNDPENYMPPQPGRGKLYGFQYRVKTTASAEEAIERTVIWMRETGKDAGLNTQQVYERAATEYVHDSVRYTVHMDEATFGEDTQKFIDKIASTAMLVEVKNTWDQTRIPYRGVNVVFIMEDGFKYEVQFHTAESQVGKDKMHGLYEEQRTYEKNTPRWLELEKQMAAIGNDLTVPNGAAEIRPPSNGVIRSSARLARSYGSWYYQLNTPLSVRNRS